MRKLLSATTAIALAGGIAWASNIPLSSGPYDPGNAVGFLNALIQSINFGSAGLQSFLPGPVSSLATTIAYAFPGAVTVIPTGQFTSAGQGMRITCGGISGANVDNKAVAVFVAPGPSLTATTNVAGAVASTGTFAVASSKWEVSLLLQANATPPATPNSFVGHGFAQSNAITSAQNLQVNAGSDILDNMSGPMVVGCEYVQGTAAADLTLEVFTIEQVK